MQRYALSTHVKKSVLTATEILINSRVNSIFGERHPEEVKRVGIEPVTS